MSGRRLASICTLSAVVLLANAPGAWALANGSRPKIVSTQHRAKLLNDSGALFLIGAHAGERVKVLPSDTKRGVVVHDSAGFVRKRPGCRYESKTTAVCGEVDQLALFGSWGGDRITISRQLHEVVLAIVYGGLGDDILRSPGPTQLILNGGEGNDLLRSGSSADTLEGGPGRDRFFAGRGADDVNAAGGPHDRDGVIRCGKGIDHANTNRGDPKAQSCERYLRPT